jgi:hypothetical protein
MGVHFQLTMHGRDVVINSIKACECVVGPERIESLLIQYVQTHVCFIDHL